MENFKLTSENYNAFSLLLSILLQKVLDTNALIFDKQNDWHNSHPFYRVHGYNGIQVSQVMGIYLMFNKEFLNKFDTIVEIGTYNGGLSSWVYDNKTEDCTFVTYDIDINLRASNINGKIDTRIQDCFSENAFNDIVTMIENGGKTLVLCDGGNKPKEFNEFSKYLKSGDHIMCHDYCKDETNYNYVALFWQWPYSIETFYKDIEEAVNNNDLEPYKHDTWEFFLWGSYIKK